MIEKWMLVLLIVGCTSLVFLICFPIDFYLYRRRRRLARERKNLTMYRPQTKSNRAAQIHAKVTVAEVAAEVDFEEMNRKDRKVYRAQRGIMRFLSLIRKKSDRQTLPQHSKDFKSENSSESRVLTTPETGNTLAHSENRNHIDQSTSMRSQDFGEITRENKTSNVTSTLHDNKLGRAVSRELSTESNVWREDRELVAREGKQQNYGAFKPLDNVTGTNDPAESRSFTIPVRSRNTVFVQPENDSESNTTTRDHNGSHQDIIVESKAAYDQSVLVNGVSGFTGRHPKQQSEENGSYTHLSVEDDSRKVYTPIQEFRDSDHETEFYYHENLKHSNSDQCISYIPKQSKAPFKPRIKANVISPTNKLTSSYSEQFRFEEKEHSALSNKRTLSLSTTFEEPSLSSTTKKKKKKDFFLKKQSSDSMPELQRYQKEKF
ncbi:uncharacterized protein LOC128547088 isoform X2 [Mercenaria mercenaria]|nr:uncharacterized protein LOC128547088 isoform X2 [Mercenaria mercenaria]